MPSGNLLTQAIQAANADMATAEAAAQAICTAIDSTKPWITNQTWTGNVASTWCGHWNGFNRQLENTLNNQLPGAEHQAVTQMTTQMEHQQAAAAAAAAKAVKPAAPSPPRGALG